MPPGSISEARRPMPIFWISALREVWSTGIGKKSRMILFGFRFMIYGVENRGFSGLFRWKGRVKNG
jgi:hypothetical protein